MSGKLNLRRIPVKKLPVEDRKRTFEEVSLGYSAQQAREEASRCLECSNAGCLRACPVCVDIPGFVVAVRDGEFSKAAEIIRSKNSLPAVTGRVCPHNQQCEAGCVLSKKKAPLAIGRLERFVADWEFRAGESGARKRRPREQTGYGVAVIGSGPAGLTCAADLATMGHRITIFEALHIPGGVLVYGIPQFRLPKEIVREEIEYVKSLGVEIKTDALGGRLFEVDDLRREYDAVFIAVGAGSPIFLGIPGEELKGIYSANEYLTRINLMKAHRFPEYDTPVHNGERVAVIGGGNVAIDAARSALRMGSRLVYVVYRRSVNEMPANVEERLNAAEEGIILKLLSSPVRFIGDDAGRVKAMEICEMMLGEPDASGRCRPIMMEDSTSIIEIDMAILALGSRPNPLLPSATPDLKTSRKGTIDVDHRGRTSKVGVWAGGDIVSGGATVVSAMGAGKAAALDIDQWLRDRSLPWRQT